MPLACRVAIIVIFVVPKDARRLNPATVLDSHGVVTIRQSDIHLSVDPILYFSQLLRSKEPAILLRLGQLRVCMLLNEVAGQFWISGEYILRCDIRCMMHHISVPVVVWLSAHDMTGSSL